MNNNSLKSKFDDFKPSPKPGDWEQMEILLERSKFRYGFLISIMMAVVASGGLLFLYGHMYIPDNIEKFSKNVVLHQNGNKTNSLMTENGIKNIEAETEKYQSRNELEKFVSIKKVNSPSQTKFKDSSGENFNNSVEISRNTNIFSSMPLVEKETEYNTVIENDPVNSDNLYSGRGMEEFLVLPLTNYEVVREMELDELGPIAKLKKNNFRFMSLSLDVYSPVYFFETATARSSQTNLGVNIHRGNLFLGINFGATKLVLPNHTAERLGQEMLDAAEVKLEIDYNRAYHLNLKAGYSFRLANKIILAPYIGLAGLSLQQVVPSEKDGHFVNIPGVGNSTVQQLLSINEKFLFLQGGASISYLINARWSVHADCSYQQSLSREKMSILSPGLGLSYRFQL